MLHLHDRNRDRRAARVETLRVRSRAARAGWRKRCGRGRDLAGRKRVATLVAGRIRSAADSARTLLRLSRRDREKLSSINVRAESQKSVNGNWTAAHAAILKRAALDPRVDRIFVTPPVKIEFCKTASRKDRKWLQKIRPIYGHNYHFHVRLKCPKGARGCVTQSPTVKELSKGKDGCDETLEWWVTDYLDPPKATKPSKPAPKKKSARDFTMADLPGQCGAVLSSR